MKISPPFSFARPVSLAIRVTALVGLAMMLVILAFNWISIRSLHQHFEEMDEEELGVITSSIVEALKDMTYRNDARSIQRAVRGHHGVYYYVTSESGEVLYVPSTGPNLAKLVQNEPPTTKNTPRRMAIWAENGSHYRGAVIDAGYERGLKQKYKIAVAISIDTHLVFIEDFKRIQWWTLCIVMCIAILVVLFAVRWGHLPIHRANEKIRSITSSRLDTRLNTNEVPIELEETIRSFNGMLDRIQEGYSRVASVSADIAHELRTPVTNMTTQTEVVLGQPRTAEEYRETLYSNLEELGRLGRMINDMLFLAQTDNTRENLHLEPVNLKRIIEGLFEYFEAWVEERGVSLKLTGDVPLIRADEDMLRRAISNLLSNAIRYTPSGSQVTVQLHENAGLTMISVDNPGSRIPPEEIPLLFTRFYRGDPARTRQTDGAGLGLAIVKTIIEAHGGTVRVDSDDRVTRFSIELPTD